MTATKYKLFAEASQTAVIVKPDEGRKLWVWGDLYTIKISGAETNGAYALIECVVGPESGTPLHIHHAEDEMFYILSGALSVWTEGQKTVVGTGSYVYIPQGLVHAWKNESDEPVRFLTSVTPAGFEQFFVAIGQVVSEALPTPPALTPEMIDTAMRLAPDFHMEVVEALDK